MANQLAIYKHEPQDYREQIQLEVRAGLELGASELQVQCSNHSATLPPASCCLPVVQSQSTERGKAQRLFAIFDTHSVNVLFT